MLRNWLRTARDMLRLSGAIDQAHVQRIQCILDIDQFGQPVLGDSIRAEQHRIQMVHIQNRQLQMNIEMWNQCSISSLYATQVLLLDQSHANIETMK